MNFNKVMDSSEIIFDDRDSMFKTFNNDFREMSNEELQSIGIEGQNDSKCKRMRSDN